MQHDALCASLSSAIDHLPPNQLVHLLRAFPPARHTELVARPIRSPTFAALSSRLPPYCRHGCKLMAVPRGFSRGFLAAETGRPLPLPSRQLKQTHGASSKGSTLPFTTQNTTLGARGASPREVAHAERRWRMDGGYTPPAEAAPPLMRGRHASCGWSEGGSQLLRHIHAAPRRVATPPVPATDPEHSEPGGAGVRGRGALSGGSTRGARGAGAEPSGAKGFGFESFGELP